MISDLNGTLRSRQFLNVANERTCFASCASTFKSTGLFTCLVVHFGMRALRPRRVRAFDA